ncbi:aromatic acid exporter family protein [Vagococcus vulneris]|uniref:Putative aromatic acid exporter C-terminal domain-containing protein n=1 Tax=Vagococcus vulneris TaxID=1977869 RepID=A0A429ZXV0_9ENTE|nr:aromatic acid exporter family protein [Vagococcus vulneris]RST98727.1 hypothetical protein CBF37_06670 [Vagococcus vulneris]
MKIGLRTIKTVIASVVSILLADYLGLQFASTAGIIAILSVTTTKKSSFKVGIGRILALMAATIIAYVCYYLVGYNAFSFGLFLLVYIPIAAKFKVVEAIPVNSVLVTHFLNAGEMTMGLVANAFGLLIIGVGSALLANLYMPNVEKEIQKNKKIIDDTIKLILLKLSNTLISRSNYLECELLIEGLSKSIKQGKTYAQNHYDNQLIASDGYHIEYFQMRRMQLSVLEAMLHLIRNIHVSSDVAEDTATLLQNISESYREDNDGQALIRQINRVYQMYEKKPLPVSREEFENRAKLFQLLNEIQVFIDIKVNFSQPDDTGIV